MPDDNLPTSDKMLSQQNKLHEVLNVLDSSVGDAETELANAQLEQANLDKNLSVQYEQPVKIGEE
ncbi:MAG TPA: hypothetical protein V6C76_14810 [Drouetiella sp.]